MPPEPSDPTVIRSLAVTSGDVVAALELNRTSDDHAALRVTPPFSARMRARLHVDRSGEGQHQPASDTAADGRPSQSRHGGKSTSRADGQGGHGGYGPLYVEPEQLVTDPPEYPQPTDTRAELLADSETDYTVERHHEYHAKAIEEWRESVLGCICDQSTLDTPDGPTDVTVRTLESDML